MAPTDVIEDEDIELEEDDETQPVSEEEIEGEDLVDEPLDVPWHGVLAPEGVPSGDYRMFAVDSLTWRDLPLPLMYDVQTADGHQKKIIGRIDELWKESGLVMGRGVFRNVEESFDAIDAIATGFVRGLSVEVDDMEVTYEELSDEDFAAGKMGTATITKARIAGVAIVGTPAYQEAYIALGADFPAEDALVACGCAGEVSPELIAEIEAIAEAALEEGLVASATFAPGTKDGPGWITHPRATSRIRKYWVSGKGAAKIRWGVPGDFNRCRALLSKYVQNPDWLAGLCANMHKEALGVWPGQEGGGRHGTLVAAAEGPLGITAAARPVVASSLFENPNLLEATPLTIVGDRIFGHAALWGTCHIGVDGECVTPPFSSTDYAYFRTGTILTDAGEVRVGQLTMETGHASTRWRMAKAMAHYDDTGTAVADVATGEDAVGIWFSGRIRKDLTEDQMIALSASTVSGDWRKTPHGWEFVAALIVNVPGYPVPRMAIAASAGEQIALVASGVVDRELEESRKFSTDEIVDIIRATTAETVHRMEQAPKRQAVREMLAERAAAKRSERLAKVRAQIGAE